MSLDSAWVVQRTDGVSRLWWSSGRRGFTPYLIHAGIYTHAEARSIVRQYTPGKPETCTHTSMQLSEALGLVHPGTVATYLISITPTAAIVEPVVALECVSV